VGRVLNIGTAAQRALALRIARSIGRVVPPNVQLADLEQAALVGLWQGLCRRGPDADAPYLRCLIRGSVRDELRRQDWLPRRRTRKQVHPFTAHVLHFEDVGTEAEQRLPSRVEGADELLAQKRALEEVLRVRLPERLRRVIDLQLAGYRQTEIARELGISQARVSQLTLQALGLLRAARESAASAPK
jgi:RNA polymerase sigma factor (sigma-70 family)